MPDKGRRGRVAEILAPVYKAEGDWNKLVGALEAQLESWNRGLPALKEFILPGGGPAAAACHLARTVTRRAERRVWELSRVESIAPEVPRYLNRLSDLLFVIARVLARAGGHGEVLWNHDRRQG